MKSRLFFFFFFRRHYKWWESPKDSQGHTTRLWSFYSAVLPAMQTSSSAHPAKTEVTLEHMLNEDYLHLHWSSFPFLDKTSLLLLKLNQVFAELNQAGGCCCASPQGKEEKKTSVGGKVISTLLFLVLCHTSASLLSALAISFSWCKRWLFKWTKGKLSEVFQIEFVLESPLGWAQSDSMDVTARGKVTSQSCPCGVEASLTPRAPSVLLLLPVPLQGESWATRFQV